MKPCWYDSIVCFRFTKEVMYSYIDQLDFANMNFVPALRKFLEGNFVWYVEILVLREIGRLIFEQVLICSLKY